MSPETQDLPQAGQPEEPIQVRRNQLRHSLGLLLRPGSRLSQRVLHASFWSFALRLVVRSLSSVRTIILARLLLPEDFGVMGIALITMVFMESFTQTGFKAALVQHKGDIRPYLDTAWTLELLRSLLLAGALVLAAPYVASFFNAPATMIVRVMAIGVLLTGLKNIATVYFQKDLEFQKKFVFEVAEPVCAVAVGIALALLLQNVWALVFSILAGRAAQVVASYLVKPYHPRLRLDWTKAKELYHFGVWMSLNSILYFFARRGDALVVGKVLGPVSLGVYELGRRLSDMATREISSVSSEVAFPTFAQIQDDLPRLRKIYFTSLELVATIAIPIAVILSLLAEPVISLVLGEKWLSVASVLPFLAISGGILAVCTTGGALFRGVGRPGLSFGASLVRVATMLVLIPLLIKEYGIAGAGIGVLAGTLTNVPFLLWYLVKILRVTLLQVVRPLLPAVILTATAAVTVLIGKWLFGPLDSAELILTILLSASSYVLVSLLLWRTVRKGPFQVLALLR